MSNEKDQEPTHDPAASMSLLTQLLANPLDAGYSHHEDIPDSPVMRWAFRGLVVAAAVILGVASTMAVRSLRSPEEVDVHTELLTQTRTQIRTVDSLQSEVEDLSQSLRGYTESGMSGAAGDDPVLDALSGTTAVEGPGVVVVLEDAPQAGAGGKSGKVRDHDLQVVVNALWSSGAEAISINGIRIGPATFIRKAGSSILVNITAVQSPYEVTAIGNSNELSTSLVRGATGDHLSTVQSASGISVTARAESSVTMDTVEQPSPRIATPITTRKGH